MTKEEKGVGLYKIDKKWLKEEPRLLSEFPGMPRSGVLGEEETWLELIQYYRDDLKWLLSLEHHKFWSYIIFSEKAHKLLTSFLSETSLSHLRNTFFIEENIRSVYSEVEHLVFLAFLRISTEKESEGCFIRNFGEIIYNNYLFTVPIILDICLIYGASNKELVKTMINNIISTAPYFLDDFQEIFPHFLHVLKVVKEKFCMKQGSVLKARNDLSSNEADDLVWFLSDAVATVELFFEIYPNICQIFSRSEIVKEVIFFYSNVLPEMLNFCKQNGKSHMCDIIENARIDFLKIVKNIFDFILNESNEISERKEALIKEYIELMSSLLPEQSFLHDYNLIYSIEFELGCVTNQCQNIDQSQVNSIIEAVALAENIPKNSAKANESFGESDVKLMSLITEVKDIFPHLEDDYIRKCLDYFDNNTERVIAAVLENNIPHDLDLKNNKYRDERIENSRSEIGGTIEFKNKHRNFNELLDDKEEINKLRERYAEFSIVADDTYDDEYDDTYDENISVAFNEGDEVMRRPLVVPRVLRGKEESDEEEEDFEEEEEELEEVNESMRRNHFVEDPAVIRERMEQKRIRGRGRINQGGDRQQVLRERGFKEAHKSSFANHNRKRGASRKMARGMIPS